MPGTYLWPGDEDRALSGGSLRGTGWEKHKHLKAGAEQSHPNPAQLTQDCHVWGQQTPMSLNPLSGSLWKGLWHFNLMQHMMQYNLLENIRIFIFIFCSYRTSCHKLSAIKQEKCIMSHIFRSSLHRVSAQDLSRLKCRCWLGCCLIEASGFSSKHVCCWQNAFPFCYKLRSLFSCWLLDSDPPSS